MKPLVVFSKFSPRASRSDDLIVTLGSRRMLAGALSSGKKRQPAASSSLLILMRAVASLFAMRFLSVCMMTTGLKTYSREKLQRVEVV